MNALTTSSDQNTQASKVKPGSLSPSRFLGCSSAYFIAEERRSLTVHIPDLGWFDVYCEGRGDEDRVLAGRYEDYATASNVRDQLNNIWRVAPNASAREVVIFALGASADLLTALQAQEEASAFAAALAGVETIDKMTHDKADALFARATTLRRDAISKAEGLS